MTEEEYYQHPEGRPFRVQGEGGLWILEFARSEAQKLHHQTKGGNILKHLFKKKTVEQIEDEVDIEMRKLIDDRIDFLQSKLLKKNRIRSQETKQRNKKFKRSQS